MLVYTIPITGVFLEYTQDGFGPRPQAQINFILGHGMSSFDK